MPRLERVTSGSDDIGPPQSQSKPSRFTTSSSCCREAAPKSRDLFQRSSQLTPPQPAQRVNSADKSSLVILARDHSICQSLQGLHCDLTHPHVHSLHNHSSPPRIPLPRPRIGIDHVKSIAAVAFFLRYNERLIEDSPFFELRKEIAEHSKEINERKAKIENLKKRAQDSLSSYGSEQLRSEAKRFDQALELKWKSAATGFLDDHEIPKL